MTKSGNLLREIQAQACDVLFGRPIMDNVVRGIWVEILVWLLLGKNDWEYSGRNWAPYDLYNKQTDTRLEVKQSAVRQPWSVDKPATIRFDIAPRFGFWSDKGGTWNEMQGRQADIYVFASHELWEPGSAVDHRDPSQWQFLVLPASELPNAQKNISHNGLCKLGAVSADMWTLRDVVMKRISASGRR